jgi:integrase
MPAKQTHDKAVKLTKRIVEKAPIPAPGKRTVLWDSRVPGFGVRVTDRGVRTFFLVYGPRNQRQRMKLGEKPFPGMTVDAARALAIAELERYGKGINPLGARREERSIPGWRAWVETYLQDVASAKKSEREDKRYLGIATERWGRRPLNRITTADVEKVFRSIAAAGHKTAANRWLASVRACLQHAWRLDKIPSNPAMKVRPLPEPDPRHRILSDEEFKKLLTAVAALKDPWVRGAFTILVETGCRLSEVLNARWADVDLDAAVWRIPRPKSGKPETLPLAPATVEAIRDLPRQLGNPYLIPGKKPGTHRVDLKDAWDAVRKAAGLTEVVGEGDDAKVIGTARLHDLRKTFGLHVAKAAGLAVASRLLRHSDVRVTERHYARLETDDLRAGLAKRAEVLAFPAKAMAPRKRKAGAK